MCQTKPFMLRSRALWLHYMLDTVSDDDHFDMRTFVQRRNDHSYNAYASFIGVTAGWPWCSTASCIGGTIIMLGFTPEQRASDAMKERGFSQIAAEWLGLDNDEPAQRLSSVMFSPGPLLNIIKRHHAISAVQTLYETGVWSWRDVPGMFSFEYARWELWPGDRGDPISVEWRAEPDPMVANLFLLRDRVKRAYWDGKGSQPFGASLDNDTPVCLLTGVGAVTRSFGYVGDSGEKMRDALRAATPLNTSFVHVSDSGLDAALALIDRAILVCLGVIPAVRPTLPPIPSE